MTKIVCFDLDGTLTESKTELDHEMASLVCELLKIKIVVVIGGASFKQFQRQFLLHIRCEKILEKLFILPTSGASFYKYDNNKWQPVYQLNLSPIEKKQIYEAFEKTFIDIDYHHPQKIYGQVIEDRGSEIVFSTLGQEAPLSERLALRADSDRRPEIKNSLKHYLPKFEISLSGVNSIDVTRIGIDKGYAIEQIEKVFKIPKEEIVFVGDAVYEGRNDFAVVRTGVEIVKVSGPADTKRFIKSLLVLS